MRRPDKAHVLISVRRGVRFSEHEEFPCEIVRGTEIELPDDWPDTPLVVGVALEEVTEAMGRLPRLKSPWDAIEFRVEYE